ncbi:MAG: dihydrofolate reductase [Pseudomonadota bacterium]
MINSPPRPRISLIAAIARNGTIGHNNALLWHLPPDLQHFKRTTLGHPVIMGRKTWDSIGRPLPERHNIVITRNAAWTAPGATRAAGWPQALAAAGTVPQVFVIGGAEIYALALLEADELVLTEVDREVEGDTDFPPWSHGDFIEQSREPQAVHEGWPYAFVTYRRRSLRKP